MADLDRGRHRDRLMAPAPRTSLTAVKAHLSHAIDEVTGNHDRVVVTRNGCPVAIIMAVNAFESLMKTLDRAVTRRGNRSVVSQLRRHGHRSNPAVLHACHGARSASGPPCGT
jgi:prevent-host-death family protein